MSDLLTQYREMAALGGNFRGFSLLQHAKEIGEVVRRHRARTLLDYGSGAGDAYRSPHFIHDVWGLRKTDIRCYDPSFPQLKLNKPIVGTFDGVICSDVLEHVPEADVEKVIQTLFNRADDFVWASVCCRPAKKFFADGTNMHVTIKPLVWWQGLFEALCDCKTFYLVETP